MRSTLRALSSICVVLTYACSDTTDTPDVGGPEDTGPPPDTCTTAAPCPLVLGTMTMERLTPVGDDDRFTFTVPAAANIINVIVNNDANFSPIRLEVALFGPDGTSLDNQRFQMNGKQRVEIQKVAPSAGTYVVLVRDVGNDGEDRSNPYFVLVSVLSETDNNEPNDTAATATTLTPGTPTSGTIGAQDDADWFKVDVAANSLLQIDVSAPGLPTPVRFKWELYNSDGTMRIAESFEPMADVPWPLENRAVGNTAGTYTIKVFDDPADGVQAAAGRVYALTARVVAEVDVQDLASPNETAPMSTIIAGQSQTFTGYIAATSDSDFYRITVTNAPRIIRVQAQMPVSDVDLSFVVLGHDQVTPICMAEDGDICRALRIHQDGATAATLTTAHVARTNGAFYIQVRDFQDNDFDTTVPYTITIDVPADPDVRENFTNDRAGAIPINPTSSTSAQIQWPWITGYLSYVNDEDWYSVYVPGPGGSFNGDWTVTLEMQVTGPTRVETQNWLYSELLNYGAKGYECREPTEQDPFPCEYPEAQNTINRKYGECADCNPQECFTMFREQTRAGRHYFKLNDLDKDDYDMAPTGEYRFRLTVTPNCVLPGMCEGRFRDNACMGSTGMNADDCCGRP